jgi:hypothetical protein
MSPKTEGLDVTSLSNITIHIISQGDASREGQVLEESIPVDIVIIGHGSTETKLKLLISNPPPEQLLLYS